MTVCAWCETVITARPDPTVVSATPSPQGPSHGICHSCLSARIASDRVQVAPTAAFASR